MKEQKFELKPSVSNKIVNENGDVYSSVRSLARNIGVGKSTILYNLRNKGYFKYNGVSYFAVETKPISDKVNKKEQIVIAPRDDEEEYQQFLEASKVSKQPFELYNIESKVRGDEVYRYAVSLFSDAHIEETVTRESVLGKNEYNIDIAKERIKNYFSNLTECLNEDKVSELIFASLGDTISGYIHDELAQCNGLSPLEATFEAQSLIYSGLKYIYENSSVSHINFIGIVGNHSRTTKRIQHSNGYRMSYEWLMYKNIEKECKANKLPIDFCIPNCEFALVTTPDNKKFLFAHGFQIKGGGSGTICGIYPALNRLSMKLGKTYNQDKIFIGHFHSCTSIPNAVVNGSIIGYNAFALTNGFIYEEPCQYYAVYDKEVGELLERKIYCK